VQLLEEICRSLKDVEIRGIRMSYAICHVKYSNALFEKQLSVCYVVWSTLNNKMLYVRNLSDTIWK